MIELSFQIVLFSQMGFLIISSYQGLKQGRDFASRAFLKKKTQHFDGQTNTYFSIDRGSVKWISDTAKVNEP